MKLRPSGHLFIIFSVLTGIALLFWGDLRQRQRGAQLALIKKSDLVQTLQLTDLCLSTEATYTRHSSQADLYAPFADHPGAFEHFPSGTMITAPPHLKERHASIP